VVIAQSQLLGKYWTRWLANERLTVMGFSRSQMGYIFFWVKTIQEFDFMFGSLSFIVHKMMKAFIFMLFPLFVQVTLISDKYGLFLQRSK
jgi:hypothetical protein